MFKSKAVFALLLLVLAFVLTFAARSDGASFDAAMLAYMSGMAGFACVQLAIQAYQEYNQILCHCGEQLLRTTTERYYDVEQNIEHTYIGCSQVVPVWTWPEE